MINLKLILSILVVILLGIGGIIVYLGWFMPKPTIQTVTNSTTIIDSTTILPQRIKVKTERIYIPHYINTTNIDTLREYINNYKTDTLFQYVSDSFDIVDVYTDTLYFADSTSKVMLGLVHTGEIKYVDVKNEVKRDTTYFLLRWWQFSERKALKARLKNKK